MDERFWCMECEMAVGEDHFPCIQMTEEFKTVIVFKPHPMGK